MFLLCSLAAEAGAVEKGDLHFGLKVGPSFAYTRAEGGRTEVLTTFAGGAFLSYSVTEMFQLQPEVMYMGRGWKESEGSIELKNKLGYVDFSLLFKVAIPSKTRLSSSIGVGPYVGLKVSDSYEFNVALPSEVADAMDQIYESLKSYDAGIVVSGELDIAMDNGGMILFDVRLATGLVSIFDDITIEDVPLGSIDMKNTGFQIMAGYAF
jgi:hypothetical protein